MKRAIAILAVLLLLVLPAIPEPILGRVITITAGTAIRVIPTTSRPVQANSIFIQALHGGSGIIYVLWANPSDTCAYGGAGTTLIGELAPATASTPGGSFSFPSNGTATSGSGGTDVRNWCIDGTHSGDTVAVSYDLRN